MIINILIILYIGLALFILYGFFPMFTEEISGGIINKIFYIIAAIAFIFFILTPTFFIVFVCDLISALFGKS